MRAPRFWDATPPDWRARLLAPLGAALGAATARRFAASPGYRSAIPVLCVGNPTVGGAGKTPTVIHVVARLFAAGYRPVVLSRGYGGRFDGPLRVNEAVHTARDVGDEPLLLARHAPVVVARDRIAGARMCETVGDVLVMDDGFQNPALAKTASILVVDAVSGVGNGLCIPAGPLRMPLAPQFERCDMLLVVGDGDRGGEISRRAGIAGIAVLHGRLRADESIVASLGGRPVVAFAGIGRPGKFRDTLTAAGIDVADFRAFGDHHRFTSAEAEDLLATADRHAGRLVTTEKDIVRLRGETGSVGELGARCVALPVALELGSDGRAMLDAIISRFAGRAP